MEFNTGQDAQKHSESHSTGEITLELQALRTEIQRSFRQGQWNELSQTLYALAKLGETQGQRELCLRAQSLRELMGNRASGRAQAGERVEELYNELLFHLSHLQWLKQATH